MNRWLILIIACIINLFAGSIYAWSVFSPAKAEQLSLILNSDIGPQDLAVMFSTANAMCPVTMIVGGMFTDKFGIRKILIIGAILIGVGLFYTGCSKSLISLFISYGLIFGLGIGFVYGSIIGNTIKYFPDHRGLAAGLTSAAYGVCSVFLPPIARFSIEAIGVTLTLEMLGLITGAVILVSSFMIPPNAPKSLLVDSSAKKGRSVPWSIMVKEPAFFLMFSALFCSAASGMMIASQATNISKSLIQADLMLSALVVSLFALSNTSGRVLMGFISDRLSRYASLNISLLITLLGLSLLAFSSGKMLFLIAVVLLGIAMGGVMGIFPALTTDEFGEEFSSSNYGVMFIAVALAGYFGPMLATKFYNELGSYECAFFLAMVMTSLGIIFLALFNFLKAYYLISWKDILMFVRGKFFS